MIVKMQRPLESSMKDAPALVYNKDKSFVCEMDITPEVADIFAGRSKLYAEVQIHNDVEIELIQEIEDQEWE
jgi:hypothetical protein